MPPDKNTNIMSKTGELNTGPFDNYANEAFSSIVLQSYSSMFMECGELPLKRFRVGILATSLASVGNHTYAISNPASPCVVSAVATLDSTDVSVVKEWCQTHQLGPKNEEIDVRSGVAGFRDIIESSHVDAIYLALPYEQRKDYIPTSLASGKHVLVDYPISTSVSDMVSLFEMAHEHGLHLQDSTMFIHHHRCKQFLSSILSHGSFQGINSITASMNLRQDFLDAKVRLSNPNCQLQGCIGTLARYCVLFGVQVFYRVDCRPIWVHVITVKKDETGMPTEAKIKVGFCQDCCLNIECSYINHISVRQYVEVETATQTASMINFVFPRHSLASFLLYETDGSAAKKYIKRGECIDIAGGPPQKVMMWRRFTELSQGMESTNSSTNGGHGECSVSEVRELAYLETQCHSIVLALMESIEQGCKEVKLAPIEFPKCWR